MDSIKLNSIADYNVDEINDYDLMLINGGDNLFEDLGVAVGRGIVIAARWIYDTTGKNGCAWGY